MNQEATQKSKDVQRHSNAVTGAVLGEMERLKADLDRLHRERDAFSRQCSVMAEENTVLEQDSKRLAWMIQNHGRVEFSGDCYVTFILKNQFKATLGSDDTRAEIDKAMEMCR